MLVLDQIQHLKTFCRKRQFCKTTMSASWKIDNSEPINSDLFIKLRKSVFLLFSSVSTLQKPSVSIIPTNHSPCPYRPLTHAHSCPPSAHTPDNSFMGFVSEELNETEKRNIQQNKVNNMAVVYGKEASMWKVVEYA